MPRPRRYGVMIRFPASARSLKRAPVSYNNVRRWVCTTTASPCPTSSVSIHSAPGSGRIGVTTNIGTSHAIDSSRTRNPPGASISSAPMSPAATVHNGGACCVQTALGSPSSQVKPFTVHTNNSCANASRKFHGATSHTSARGTTTMLTIGIANALAIGEISDTCWNSASISGTIPSVIATCARVAAKNHACGRRSCSRPMPAYMSSATAPNESQNPADSTAHGSSSNTVRSAHARTVGAEPGRPSHNPIAPTISMYSVRCAGTSKPASST